MPSDDRDRQLERALARQLRSASPDAACPDAEILAAYHERTLSLEEMAQWKQHITACSRCQETLALVEESNVVQVNEEEKKKMMELVSGRFAAGGADQVPLEGALPAALPVPRGSASKQMPKRAAALRWVVPVGALAAGLLVWVAVRENHQNSMVKKSEQVEVAANRESTPSVPESSAADQTKSLPDRDRPGAPPPQAQNELRKDSAAALQPSGAFSQRVPPVASKPVLGIPKADTKEEQAHSQAAEDLSAPRMETAPAAAPTEANNYAAQTREIPLNQRAQVPAPAAPNAKATNQAVSGGRLYAQQNQKAMRQSAATGAVEVSGANLSSQSLNDVLPEGGIIIVAPVDAYSWRVGPGGKIEHSTDGSRTWMLQKSGVTTDLTAGSATSGKVCWVVGTAGTVLLTTDRGKHWKQLASPTKEDLLGVDAMDEKRASIWTASHKKSFDTNDGGVTWTLVINK